MAWISESSVTQPSTRFTEQFDRTTTYQRQLIGYCTPPLQSQLLHTFQFQGDMRFTLRLGFYLCC